MLDGWIEPWRLMLRVGNILVLEGHSLVGIAGAVRSQSIADYRSIANVVTALGRWKCRPGLAEHWVVEGMHCSAPGLSQAESHIPVIDLG